MADSIISTTESAAIIPEIWSARFFEVLLERLPFIDSVDRSYEGEIQNLGDIVNISSIPQFDLASNVGEGQRVDAKSITVSGQQLVINKRTACDYIVTKRSQMQSLEFMDDLREKAIFAINKKVQSDLISDTVPSASAPDHQIAYDAGTTLALADLLEGKELLDAQNVPEEGRKVITGSAQLNDLFNITGFTSRDFIPAGSPLTSGGFTTPILGFELDWTTESGSVTRLFHPSYMTMAMQQSLNIELFNLGVDGKRASRVNVDILWGNKQLDDKRVVSIS